MRKVSRGKERKVVAVGVDLGIVGATGTPWAASAAKMKKGDEPQSAPSPERLTGVR